jgi:hypothetical protein
MKRARVCLGLEISSRTAHLAVLESGPGSRPRLLAAKSFSLTGPDGVQSLARALRELGLAGTDCFVAWLPDGEAITHQLVNAPALGISEQLGFLKRLGEKETPGIADSDLHWELQAQGPARIGDHAGVELLAVRVARARLVELRTLARALPVRLRLATTVPLGLSRAASLLPVQSVQQGRALALASISIGRVTLTIVDAGRVRLVREFNPSLLVESGSKADPAVPVRLAEELARTVRYFEQNNHPETIDRIVLAGDPDLLERSAASLRQLVQGPVLALGPLLRAELDLAPEAEGDLGPWAVALGMALGERGPPVPNLLPAPERFRRERRGIAAVAVLAVLAAFGLAWPARQRALATAAAAEERLPGLEVLQRSAAERRSAAEAAQRDLQWAGRWRAIFDKVADSQDRWARFTVGLANVVPAPIVFSRVEAIRRGGGYRVAIDSQLSGEDPAVLEQSLREFAMRVRALPNVKQLVIAPLDLRSDSSLQPKLEFEFDNPSPFGANASLAPARGADRDEAGLGR